MNLQDIGQRIKQYREAAGLKQDELAKQVGLSITYISALERGVKLPKLETFIRIVNTLKIPSDYLLRDVLVVRNETNPASLSDRLDKLPPKEQKRVFHVVDVMIKDASD
jgi:transcriptional regulator with XRE-family HTH domain